MISYLVHSWVSSNLKNIKFHNGAGFQRWLVMIVRPARINPWITESANSIIQQRIRKSIKTIMLNKCDRSKINLPFHQRREPWFPQTPCLSWSSENSRSEEARGYALTTTTKTERLEGWGTDAGTPIWRTGEAERNIF